MLESSLHRLLRSEDTTEEDIAADMRALAVADIVAFAVVVTVVAASVELAVVPVAVAAIPETTEAFNKSVKVGRK